VSTAPPPELHKYWKTRVAENIPKYSKDGLTHQNIQEKDLAPELLAADRDVKSRAAFDYY